MKVQGWILSFSLMASLTAHAHQKPDLFDLKQPANLIAKVQFENFKTGMWKLSQLHYDIAGIDINNNSADVIINENEYQNLIKLGFDVQVTMTKSLMRGPDTNYKNPEKIEKILRGFESRYPNLAKVYEVGKSLQGRSIYAIKISEDVETHSNKKPTILFNGMHHAREVMGPEVTLDIIEYLLSKYGQDDKATHWVQSNEIWVMPMFNVDGNNIVWTNDSMWRKNARGNFGVDINRNYPYAWGSCNGSSPYRSAQDYRGESAASEPETNVMMNFVKTIRPVFDISYHSYSELVIYPMGCSGKRTQNFDVVESIGKEMGRNLNYTAGTAWETLYPVDGSDIDWMYAEYQVIPYVIEVNSSSEGFQPPYSKRQPTVERNRIGWQMLLDRLDGPGVRGVVTKNGEILKEFNVIVEKNAAPYMTFKGKLDGSYHLVLNPGDYKIRIDAPGITSEKLNVSVNNSRSELNFNL